MRLEVKDVVENLSRVIAGDVDIGDDWEEFDLGSVSKDQFTREISNEILRVEKFSSHLDTRTSYSTRPALST